MKFLLRKAWMELKWGPKSFCGFVGPIQGKVQEGLRRCQMPSPRVETMVNLCKVHEETTQGDR